MIKKEYKLEEFLSFMDCPLQHDFLFNKNVLKKDSTMLNVNLKTKSYNEAIETTIAYYYSQKMLGEVILLKGMYSKFQNTFYSLVGYEGEKTVFERDIYETKHRVNMDKKRFLHKGWETIKIFYDNAESQPQAIIAHNYPFKIPFGDIVITGKIELIREVQEKNSPRKNIELVCYSTSQRVPDEFQINHDLYTTFMHYAFNYIFKESPDRIVLSYIAKDSELYIYRNKKEYNRLFASIEYFQSNINNGKIFPRQGINCNACPVKEYCDKYIF